MLNRWLGIASVCVMLAVNAALVIRDIVPAWNAGDAPASSLLDLPPDGRHEQQIGIYRADDRLIGKSWTIAKKNGEMLITQSWTVFEPLRIGNQFIRSRLTIKTTLQFNAKHQIDTLQISVLGLDDPMNLMGDFVEPDDFACRWEAAGKVGTFNLPAETLHTFSDATRPFSNMKDLRIGQTWRMQVFNPLAGLMPDGGGAAFSGGTTVVRVTGQENLFFNGTNIPVFIVETEGAVAWVAPDGRVLRQEIELPVLGRLVLVEEPYNNEERIDRLQDTGN